MAYLGKPVGVGAYDGDAPTPRMLSNALVLLDGKLENIRLVLCHSAPLANQGRGQNVLNDVEV